MQGHFSTGLLAAFLALTTTLSARAQSFQDGLDQLPVTPTGEAARRLADLAHTLATAPLTGATLVAQLPSSARPHTLSAVPDGAARPQREAVAIFQRQNLGPLEVRLKTGHVYVGEIVNVTDDVFFFKDTSSEGCAEHFPRAVANPRSFLRPAGWAKPPLLS